MRANKAAFQQQKREENSPTLIMCLCPHSSLRPDSRQMHKPSGELRRVWVGRSIDYKVGKFQTTYWLAKSPSFMSKR